MSGYSRTTQATTPAATASVSRAQIGDTMRGDTGRGDTMRGVASGSCFTPVTIGRTRFCRFSTA